MHSLARIAVVVLVAAAAAVGAWAITRALDDEGGAPPREGAPAVPGPGTAGSEDPATLRGRQPSSAPSRGPERPPPARTGPARIVPGPAAVAPAEPGSPEGVVFEALGREQPEAAEIVHEWMQRREEYEEVLPDLIREGEAARGALEDYDRQAKEQYRRLVDLVGQQAADRIVAKVVVYRVDLERLRLARIGPGGRLVPVEKNEDEGR